MAEVTGLIRGAPTAVKVPSLSLSGNGQARPSGVQQWADGSLKNVSLAAKSSSSRAALPAARKGKKGPVTVKAVVDSLVDVKSIDSK